MAKLVTLKINDDQHAKVVIDSLLRKEALSTEEVFVMGAAVLSSAEVVNVVAQPTKFCDCGGSSGNSRRLSPTSGFSRTKRFGWWVHAACKKPTQQWSESIVAVVGGSHNILSEYQTDGT